MKNKFLACLLSISMIIGCTSVNAVSIFSKDQNLYDTATNVNNSYSETPIKTTNNEADLMKADIPSVSSNDLSCSEIMDNETDSMETDIQLLSLDSKITTYSIAPNGTAYFNSQTGELNIVASAPYQIYESDYKNVISQIGKENITSLIIDSDTNDKVTFMKSESQILSNFSGLFLSYQCAYMKLNLDTSNVTNMNYMFYGCFSLTDLDVSNFDTGNVTDMSGMFSGCSSLTNLDVSNWKTSNVTIMYYMFSNCSSLTILDVNNWNVSNVKDMYGMNGMFSGCSALTDLDLSNWNTNNVISMGGMFESCSSLTTLDVSNWNTNNVTDMGGMFSGCSSLTNLDLSNWKTSNVASMQNMFSSCSSLINLDVSNWNTSNVKYMNCMFQDCSSLTNLDVSNWNTGNVTDMSSMFSGCSSLIALDVSDWDTSKITTTVCMFEYCSSLSDLNASNWNTNKIKDMYWMFWHCDSLTHLDISNWNLSVSGQRIFTINSCSSLDTIYVPKSNFSRYGISLPGTFYNMTTASDMKRYTEFPKSFSTPVLLKREQYGKVILSETNGTVLYPNTKTFTITENLSDGNLTVVSSDRSVATVSINGETVTITPGTKPGTSTITVTSAMNKPYTEATATYTIEVNFNYTLTINPNGGSWNNSTSTQTRTIMSNDSLEISNPTRTGYVFNGWTITGKESSISGTTFTMGSEDATITANWKINQSTVTYIDRDADGKELGRTTKQIECDAFVRGEDIGNDTTDNAYYNQYRYVNDTNATVTASGVTVYRNFEFCYTSKTSHLTWNDNNNAEKLRPQTYTLELLCNNNIVKDIELPEAQINYTFSHLPAYDKDGKEYEYTLNAYAGQRYYTSFEDENIIIENYQPSSFSVHIPKKIVLDGRTGNADYTVTVSGTFYYNDTLTVKPDTSFIMTDKTNIQQMEANVTQIKTVFTKKDFVSGVVNSSGFLQVNKTYFSGYWTGTFNFDIKFIMQN